MITSDDSTPLPTPPRLPEYGELAWMMFMQPVALERRLKASGIEHPDEPAWKLLLERGPKAATHREYLRRMRLLLSAIPCATGLTLAYLLYSLGFPPWDAFLFAVGGAVLGFVTTKLLLRDLRRGAQRGFGAGALGATLGLLILGAVAFASTHFGMGPASHLQWRVPVGVVFGLLAAFTGRVAISAASLAAFGVMSLIPRRIFGSLVDVVKIVGSRLIAVVAIGGAVGWIVHLNWPTRELIPALWVASVVAGIALPRLFIYPLEVVYSGLLYYSESRGVPTLDRSPVFSHELSYLPYPWLRKHMLYVADRDPALVRRVLDACNVTPGQRELGREVLAQLQARELEALTRKGDFAAVRDLAGPHWLPGRAEGAPSLLARFGDLGRLLAQADGSGPHARLAHILRAEQTLRAVEHDILADASPLGRALRITLPTWRHVIGSRLPSARRQAESTLRNPFRPQHALDPSAGEEVFRGRDALVREIRSLLVDEEQGRTIVVLGPRRCGKTSLLKMLPRFLPDTLCIFFDPQHNTVRSPAGFLVALAARAGEAAAGRIDLPPLREGASFGEGCAWFRSLEDVADDRRILVCIDEVERLEELYAEHPRDVDQMLGLFRATMQHRNKVRLLISAKAPFEELPELWNDHFISAQELWLDHLDEGESVALVSQPTRDFPPEVVPREVARAIYERTGGQPFLLQAYGSHLVSLLNQEKRWRARIEDVAAVEEKVLVGWRGYFANIADEAPPEAERALEDLAEGRAPALAHHVRRWLRYRCLLAPDGRLRIPALGRWIREHA